MKKSSSFNTARTVIAGFVVLLAFGIFILFYQNSDTILQSEFYPFITLTVIGFSLLLGLLYLVNNSKHPSVRVTKAHRSSVRKHKRSRR